jgi:hypothetical protein
MRSLSHQSTISRQNPSAPVKTGMNRLDEAAIEFLTLWVGWGRGNGNPRFFKVSTKHAKTLTVSTKYAKTRTTIQGHGRCSQSEHTSSKWQETCTTLERLHGAIASATNCSQKKQRNVNNHQDNVSQTRKQSVRRTDMTSHGLKQAWTTTMDTRTLLYREIERQATTKPIAH